MNYKRMWLILKKIVSEEYVVWRCLKNSEYFKGRNKGRQDEAKYILDEMEIIEEAYKEIDNEGH